MRCKLRSFWTTSAKVWLKIPQIPHIVICHTVYWCVYPVHSLCGRVQLPRQLVPLLPELMSGYFYYILLLVVTLRNFYFSMRIIFMLTWGGRVIKKSIKEINFKLEERNLLGWFQASPWVSTSLCSWAADWPGPHRQQGRLTAGLPCSGNTERKSQ